MEIHCAVELDNYGLVEHRSPEENCVLGLPERATVSKGSQKNKVLSRANANGGTNRDTAIPCAAPPCSEPIGFRMLNLGEVIQQTGLKKTTIYKLQKLGRFPKSVRMTDHCVRWIESEVRNYISTRAM